MNDIIKSNSKVIYIVGVGRSGTSLLQSMLASHNKINYLPENSFIRRFVATGKLSKLYTSKGPNSVIEKLQSDEPFMRLDIDPKEIISQISDHSDKDVSLYNLILNNYILNDIDWLGDKDPRLVEYLGLLKYINPKSFVIHVIRDPRDVLVSKKKAKWSKKGHVWKHIFANRIQYVIGCRDGMAIFGSNYHEIVYEELISSPEEILRSLCNKINIDFDSNMLSYVSEAYKLMSPSEVSWKKETIGPILENNKNKWISGLSSKEVELVQRCCKKQFADVGYEFQSDISLNIFDRVWVVTGVFLIKLFSIPYLLFRKFEVNKRCREI